MNTIIKISASQGGEFSSTNNLVDFSIEDDGSYDLSKSYVNLVTRVDVEDDDLTTGTGIYNAQVYWKNKAGTQSSVRPYNVAMVKNCNMMAGKKGRVADVRRVDVLRQNLNAWTLNEQQKNSLEYKSITTSWDNQNSLMTPWRDFHGEGTVKSLNVNHPIQVPLSQLFNIGSIRQYDADKMGKTRVHLELNIDKFGVVQRQKAGTRTGAGYEFGASNVDSTANTTFENYDTLGDWTSAVCKVVYAELNDSPYWVGQKIKFTATSGGGAPAVAGKETTITGIEWLRSGANVGKVELTFSPSLSTLTGGHTYTDVVCDGVDWKADSECFVVEYAELVLEKVAQPQKQDGISWTMFSTEQYTTAVQKNFQHQFQVEAESVNVFVMHPSSVDGLLSHNNDVDEYLLRINNEDATNRNVKVDSPLYHDRIAMTLLNRNQQLKSLTGYNRSSSLRTDDGDQDPQYVVANNKLLLVCNPLPVSKQEKLLQVNLDCGANGITDLNLYKELPRQVVF